MLFNSVTHQLITLFSSYPESLQVCKSKYAWIQYDSTVFQPKKNRMIFGI